VLRGGASNLDGMPPYLPILEALGPVWRARVEGASGPLADHLIPFLGTLFPETDPRTADVDPTSALPAGQARYRLFNAVGATLAALAGDHGLALVLDDLQWSDRPTLELLAFVARTHASSRVAIVGAYRPAEADQRPEFLTLLGELDRLRCVQVVQVGGLHAHELSDLARHHLGQPIDEPATARLTHISEGNPFFAEEVLENWRETGVMNLRAGTWHLDESIPASPPPAVTRLIRDRLSRLDSPQRDLLNLAAVIGRRFNPDLLARALGTDTGAIADLLTGPRGATMIRALSPDHFEFAHDLIRTQILSEISTSALRNLHGQIGRALRDGSTEIAAQPVADLAYHFAQSGDADEGVRWAIAAAEQAMRVYAFGEASSHYGIALNLLLPGDDRKRGQILIALGNAEQLDGHEDQAAAHYEEARASFQHAGDRLATAAACHSLGIAWQRQEELERARAAFEQAVRAYGDHEDAKVVALFADMATLTGANLHDQPMGIRLARLAVEIADRIDDPGARAGAGRALGNLLVRFGSLSEGIATLEVALKAAETANDASESAECCACLAVAHFWAGELYESRRDAQRRLIHAERSHDRYQMRHIYIWFAMLDSIQGRLEDAATWIARAEPIVQELDSPEPRAWLQFCSGMAALMVGDYERAEQSLAAAASVFREIGPETLLWYFGPLIEARIRLGRQAMALADLSEFEAMLKAAPAGAALPPEPVARLAEIALLLDDPALIERAEALLTPVTVPFSDVLTDRLRGEFALRRGDVAVAAHLFDASGAIADREAMVWEQARLLEDRAALLRTQGGRESDRERLLATAAALYERVQAPRHVARLASARSESHLPANLSRREGEVLGLLARGRSNREMADELSLSEKTIERHLSNIYAKIDVANRAGAAAYAVRHGLI